MPEALRHSSLSALLAYLLLLTGCATATSSPDCINGTKPAINDLLYFGTSKPKGLVSSEDGQHFLDTSVTPRFPNGLTVWTGQGQWQGNTGQVAQERTFLLNIIHPDDNVSETAINTIMNEYRHRFEHEAVSRAKNPVCTISN